MVKVKICGLRRFADIEAANQTKPDYVGFIFVKGTKRYISPQQAAQLRKGLSQDIQTVGVFVNEAIEEIVQICQQGIIDLVQLHGDEDSDYIEQLKSQIDQAIIQTVLVDEVLKIEDTSADFLLFDSRSPSRGGSGQTFDWQLIATYTDKPFFLAGGLGIHNIEAALKIVQPFAVDASSSIETEGYKDLEKMTKFIDKIREETHDNR